MSGTIRRFAISAQISQCRTTARPRLGEGDTGLPGSKSVARAEGDTRNRGGPKHSGRSNCESQAGTTTQRQGVSSGDSGVGSAHNRSLQGQSPEATEGTDMSMPPAQGTSTVRMTEKDWQTFLRALAEKAKRDRWPCQPELSLVQRSLDFLRPGASRRAYACAN